MTERYYHVYHYLGTVLAENPDEAEKEILEEHKEEPFTFRPSRFWLYAVDAKIELPQRKEQANE